MIKGFILIIFLLLIWQNFTLRKAYINQREYFIKVLNHDLRVATLAQIRGIELLEKNNASELISDIKEACKYSLDMISMLLNIYRFEKKEQILNYEVFNPRYLFAESCEMFLKPIEEKGVSLDIIDNLNSSIYADRNLIFKVFTIFLSTVIENAFQNSKVSINFSQISSMFVVSFIYSGKVLTEEECRRIFSNNHSFLTVGQGIKLMLCKKIVDFHKGRVLINNSGYENVFQISLPLNTKQKNNCLKCVSTKLQVFCKKFLQNNLTSSAH